MFRKSGVRGRAIGSVALSATAVAVVLAGCGSGGGSSSSSSAPAETKASSELLGTYDMTLAPGDVASNAPPELADAGKAWTLKIANTGGLGGGPGIALISADQGPLESSPFQVSGDRILIHGEECAVATGLVKSEYRWALSGSTLHLTTVHSGCSDHVSETLFTAEPWKKR